MIEKKQIEERVKELPMRTQRTMDIQPKCRSCGKFLGQYLTRPWGVWCRYCKKLIEQT